MTFILDPKTIFIVEGDADHSRSLKCLLENHNRVVQIFESCDDFFTQKIHKESDTVLLNFERRRTTFFNTLNRLLFSPVRPEIVITSDDRSAFRADDQFLGERVAVLFHPYTPRELLKTIDLVGLR
jgi:FixJ family two-component response regulator